MSDTSDALLGLGLLVGVFFGARKAGYNQANNEHLQREKDRDLEALRRELADLKSQISHQP